MTYSELESKSYWRLDSLTYYRLETDYSGMLFPGIQSEDSNVANISLYKPSDYGDYKTQEISKINVYDNSNTLIGSHGSGDNVYKISGNILAMSMESAVLSQAITNVYDLINQISYVPISINLSAKPYLEVGDVVQFQVGMTAISSFILQRTLTGVTSDKLEAKGEEYHNKTYVAS